MFLSLLGPSWPSQGDFRSEVGTAMTLSTCLHGAATGNGISPPNNLSFQVEWSVLEDWKWSLKHKNSNTSDDGDDIDDDIDDDDDNDDDDDDDDIDDDDDEDKPESIQLKNTFNVK